MKRITKIQLTNYAPRDDRWDRVAIGTTENGETVEGWEKWEGIVFPDGYELSDVVEFIPPKN